MIEPRMAACGSAVVRWSCLVLAPLLGACEPDAVDVPQPGVPAAFTVRGRQADPLNLTYAIAGNGEAGADRELLAAVEAAAAVWSESELVQFRVAQEGDVASVTFSWERGQHDGCAPFGIDGSIAHTGPMGDAMFVHLDAGRAWGEDGDSMFVAALHELGHVLGLGHSMDADSVMARDERHATIQSMDWAGIHSLYRRDTILPGSLAIQRQQDDEQWVSIGMIEGVAPSNITRWSLFDTDGDGADELLVWRVDGMGHDDLMIYVFESSPDGSGPRLAATRGPFLNAARGGEVYLEDLGDGQRFFTISRYELRAGTPLLRVRQFSEAGGLIKPSPQAVLEREAFHADFDGHATFRPEGDLDGDGVLERVREIP